MKTTNYSLAFLTCLRQRTLLRLSGSGQLRTSRLALRAVLDVARQLFNFLRLFHQVETQDLARIRLIDFIFQLRGELVQAVHLFLHIFVVLFENLFFRARYRRSVRRRLLRAVILVWRQRRQRRVLTLALQRAIPSRHRSAGQCQSHEKVSSAIHGDSPSFSPLRDTLSLYSKSPPMLYSPRDQFMSSLLAYLPNFTVSNLLHLVGIFLNRLLHLVTKLIIRPASSPTRAAQAREQQTRTLAGVVYSTGNKVVWAVALITAIQEFGVNVTPVAA